MRRSSDETGCSHELASLVRTSVRMAVLSLMMTSVLTGCSPPGEPPPPSKAPSPPTTIELLRAGDARACVAADVLERLQKEVRGERRLYAADQMHQVARRRFISVTFEEVTAARVDVVAGVVECEGMLVVSTPDHNQRERTSYKISPLVTGDGIVVRASPSPAPAVKQVTDWSTNEIEAVYREVRMQDALARSTALPPALRTRYIETLDDCDQGAAPGQCVSGFWAFLDEISDAGWCQRLASESTGTVPWHRCAAGSLRETEVE